MYLHAFPTELTKREISEVEKDGGATSCDDLEIARSLLRRLQEHFDKMEESTKKKQQKGK